MPDREFLWRYGYVLKLLFLKKNLLPCYKTANISVKKLPFIELLRTRRSKQQKSVLIRPSNKIIYELRIAREFLIASQSETG